MGPYFLRFLEIARSSPRWLLRDLHGVAVIALRAIRDVPTYRQVRLTRCPHHPLRGSEPNGSTPFGLGACPYSSKTQKLTTSSAPRDENR